MLYVLVRTGSFESLVILDISDKHYCENTQRIILNAVYPSIFFRLHSTINPVPGLWEETRTPRENPCRHNKTGTPAAFKPRTFSLWGDSANRHTAALPWFSKKSFAAKNLWTSPHGVFLPLRCSARPSLHLHRVTAQFCLHALKSILCWFVIRWLTWPLKNITFLRPKNSALWNVVQSVVQHLAQSELASAFLIF